jgi:hypothetical protein|tara:strand:- start:672 stop:1025 length:354 start_codon:yes stop_codon:yes gene_type:complete
MSNTVTTAGSAGIGGAALGYIASPDGNIVIKWLSNYLGAIGFVSLIFSAVFVAGWYLTFNYFAAQKEKDEERWSQRFEQLRADTKEAFRANAAAINTVTLMMERAATGGMKMPTKTS